MVDRSDNSFQTTRWTQVVAARGNSTEAKQALRELCESYYGPVELFVRRYCGKEGDARDLTHEFFAKLLEVDGTSLGAVDRTRGRFRSYLLGAVKHHLADQQARGRTLKRGGGQTQQSLDERHCDSDSDAGEPLGIADPHGFPPDAYFDRQWALTIVEQAMASLRAEANETHERDRFEVLKRWLVAPEDRTAANEAAHSLGMSEGAFKVAVHRLRKRFRRIVADRISRTVDDATDVNDELDYLIRALTSAPASE